MDRILDVAMSISAFCGVTGAAVIYTYKSVHSGRQDYDKNTIESMKNSITALETENTIYKQKNDELLEKISEMETKLTQMASEMQTLRELVTQRAEVADLKKVVEGGHQELMIKLNAIETGIHKK